MAAEYEVEEYFSDTMGKEIEMQDNSEEKIKYTLILNCFGRPWLSKELKVRPAGKGWVQAVPYQGESQEAYFTYTEIIQVLSESRVEYRAELTKITKI